MAATKNTKKKATPSKPARAAIPDNYLRLGPAAEAAGVSKQTIEYYIMLGLIKPRRLEGRHGRFFDPLLIHRIKLIRELNKSGYTLRNILEIFLKRAAE